MLLATQSDRGDWIGQLLDDLAHAPKFTGAACGDDPRLFDVDAGAYAHRAAIALCESCPCLAQCRQHLAATPPAQRPSGVVAGVRVPAPRVRPLAEPRPPTGTDRAAAWLIEQLRSGPVISTQIHADAAEAGIQRHTLALARRRLNVQLERLTGQRGGARYWTL